MKHLSMSTVNIQSLPIEIIYHIFDYLDVKTIFCSFRCTCKQFYATINNYNRFKLNFTSNSKVNFEPMSRFIRPENIISLTFSSNYTEKFDKFFSMFRACQLTGLRSLTLNEIVADDLDRFLQHIDMYNLVSLSIKASSGTDETKILFSTMSIISRYHLQKLNLSHFDYKILKNISWPVDSTLQHLTIEDCSFKQFQLILHQLSHLRTLELHAFTSDDLEQIALSPSTYVNYSQLKSLTINYFTLSIEYLKLFLSLTPALIHLQLFSTRWSLDSLFDGACWVELIQTKLPLLSKFIFLFWLRDVPISENLNSIIHSFQTPFWLNDKHWFVTCGCILTSAVCPFMLHTLPISLSKGEILIRREALLMDRVHLLYRYYRDGSLTTADVSMK